MTFRTTKLLVLSQAALHLQDNSQVSADEILCQANNDCITTTFCCSGYSCVNPRTCLHGNKTEMDFCDYNFECLSRCCVDGKCNHILECYSQCQTNADCIGKTIEGTRVDNPRTKMANKISTGCCSSNLCTEAIVCEGNKLLGDYCDHDTECLSELCDTNNKCITHDRAQMEPALGEDILDIEMDEAKKQQMINIIVIAVVVSFLCLIAVIVSCVQKHTNRVDGVIRGAQGQMNYLKIEGERQDDNSCSDGSKHNIGQMLARGVSRKYLFNGNPKNILSPRRKYEAQTTPIFEDSQEQYNTNQLSASQSEYYKSNKTYLSKKEVITDKLQEFNSPNNVLLSQSSQHSQELLGGASSNKSGISLTLSKDK